MNELWSTMCCLFGLCRTQDIQERWFDGGEYGPSYPFGECRWCGKYWRMR